MNLEDVTKFLQALTVLTIIATLTIHWKVIEGLMEAQENYADELKKLQDMVLDLHPKKQEAE
jgi:hypothetical protein